MSASTNRYPLSPLDHLPPPNYTCTAIYLPLKSGVSPAEAFTVLQKGLHSTFAQLPWLGGKILPQPSDTPGWRPGQLELQHGLIDDTSPPPSQLKYKELFPTTLSYNDLKDSAFPTDSFRDEELIWAPFLPDTSKGCDVFVAQCNFISGGCVLVAALNHAAGDGNACFMTINLWADHCKALQSQSAPPLTPPSECSDRSLQEKIWAKEGTGKSPDEIDPNVWRLLGCDPSTVQHGKTSNGRVLVPIHGIKTAEEKEPQTLKSSIFYISPSKFTALQKECVKELGTAAQVSGAHAICGLVWRGLLKVRSQVAAQKSYGLPADEDGIARLDVLMDGRSGFSESLPQMFLGNQTEMVQSSMPLSSLTSPSTSIASIAGRVREDASRISSASFLDSYTLLKELSDYEELQRQWQGRQKSVARSGMLLTSMLLAPIERVSFGDVVFGNGGNPDSARPLMGPFDRAGLRICFVLPRTASGGVEFVVNLSEDELDLLMDDEEFERYAVYLA